MKTRMAGFWMACVLLLPFGVSQAQVGTPEFDPLGEHEDLPRVIRVQAEFIEMSHETLTALMLAPRESADDGALREEVTALIAKGEAGVLETMVVTSRSGQKSTTESIREVIYPTEYEPAEIPNQIHTTGDGEKMMTDGSQFATGPTPTAFETRNTGSMFEVEPTADFENRLIDLRFVPEIVYHVGNETWAEWKDSRGDASIRMPTFYVLRLNTSVTMENGKPMMVAVLSPKTEAGVTDFKRKVMIFVRCEVLTVGR